MSLLVQKQYARLSCYDYLHLLRQRKPTTSLKMLFRQKNLNVAMKLGLHTGGEHLIQGNIVIDPQISFNGNDANFDGFHELGFNRLGRGSLHQADDG